MLSTLTDQNPTIQTLLTNSFLRKRQAERSLAYFAFLYLPHYLKNKIPEFHFQIYSDLQDEGIGFLELIAFRGSAKSTIASLAYPLWCAVFKKKNFIVLCSDTHTQAKQIITNLIYELEHNQQLQKDFGTFRDPKEDWTATNIYLKNGVRIMSRSRGQKIRGLRHLQHRPDLTVLDDIENIDAVRTKEQRDKTEEWFAGDVVPALDAEKGKLVVIGSLLHQDSLISRLKEKILSGSAGVLREFPLYDKQNWNVWPSYYTPEKVVELRKSNLRYFKREYLLQIIAADDQIVKQVSYYNSLPPLERIAIGVDLAISKKQTADYTSINIAGEDSGRIMYNLRNVYGRWNFNEAIEKIHETYQYYRERYPDQVIHLGIEDVAYQRATIEEFRRRYGIQPTPIKQTKDKKARLEMMLPYIEQEQILFKREGQEDLLNQLLNWGVEPHDDCVDALEISIRLLVAADRPMIQWL